MWIKRKLKPFDWLLHFLAGSTQSFLHIRTINSKAISEANIMWLEENSESYRDDTLTYNFDSKWRAKISKDGRHMQLHESTAASMHELIRGFICSQWAQVLHTHTHTSSSTNIQSLVTISTLAPTYIWKVSDLHDGIHFVLAIPFWLVHVGQTRLDVLGGLMHGWW